MSEEKDLINEELASNEQIIEDNLSNEENSTENVEQIQDEQNIVQQLEEEKRELQDKYIRLYSEFENFRRRTAKESIELRQNASKDLIVELLPVLDDFERGLLAIANSEDVKTASEGVTLIFSKMRNILEKRGLKAMESKEKEFDIEFHEALTKFPAPNPDMKGKVLDEIEKGYLLNEKVIRHAKVVVAE